MIQSQTKPDVRMPNHGSNTAGEANAEGGEVSPGVVERLKSLRSGKRPHQEREPAPVRALDPSFFAYASLPGTFGGAWGFLPPPSAPVPYTKGKGKNTNKKKDASDMLASMTVTATTTETQMTIDTRRETEEHSLPLLARDHGRHLHLHARGESLPAAVLRTGEERGCGASDASLSSRGVNGAQGRAPEPLHHSRAEPPPNFQAPPPHRQDHHQRPRVLIKRSRSQSTGRRSSSRPGMGSTSGSCTSHTSSMSMSSNGYLSSPTSATSESQHASPDFAPCSPSSASSFSSGCGPTRPISYFSDLDMRRR